jgi:hypothetical protein
VIRLFNILAEPNHGRSYHIHKISPSFSSLNQVTELHIFTIIYVCVCSARERSCILLLGNRRFGRISEAKSMWGRKLSSTQSAVSRKEWSASRPLRFFTPLEPHYPLNVRQNEPHSRCGLFWGIEKPWAPPVNRPKVPVSSSPFKFDKVSCVTSVTYTLLCGVCFSDRNRQERSGSCCIIYRSPWNCTFRQATTVYFYNLGYRGKFSVAPKTRYGNTRYDLGKYCIRPTVLC